jgi:SAM-dependent methyltransferase
MTSLPPRRRTAEHFGRQSHAYAQSDLFARGDDLAVLVRLLDPHPEMLVLDEATGAGFTAAAVAPLVRAVVALDIAPQMLARTRELAAARELPTLVPVLADAEALPFADETFDAVTCRIAPHHFPDVRQALREVARVLRPGGRFVVVDNLAPSDPALDRFVNSLDALRDPTHVRAYTVEEWADLLHDAGLRPTAWEVHRKRQPVEEWLARAGVDRETAAAVHERLLGAPEAARAHFAIEVADGAPAAFTVEILIARAERA